MSGMSTKKVRPPRPQWSTRWVWVEPEVAADILANWNQPNRAKKDSHLKRVRKSVAANGWKSLDPLMFAGRFGQSRLINGQHRLHVLVERGVGEWVQVTEHVPDEQFDLLDQASARSLADALTIAAAERQSALPNALDVAALLRLRASWDRDGEVGVIANQSAGWLTLSVGVQMYLARPEMVAYASRGKTVSKGVGSGCGAAVTGFVLWLLEEQFPAEVVRDYEQALIHWDEQGETSPARQVGAAFEAARETSNRTGSRLMSRHQQMWYLLTGFDKFQAGVPSGALLYRARGGEYPLLPCVVHVERAA